MINKNEGNTMKSLKTIEMEKKIEEREKSRLRMQKYISKRSVEQLSLDRQKSNISTKKSVN